MSYTRIHSEIINDPHVSPVAMKTVNGIDLMRQQVAMIDKETTGKAFATIEKQKAQTLAWLKSFYPALFSDPDIVTGMACARHWNSICVILKDEYGLVVQGTGDGLVISMIKVKPGENYSIDPWIDLPVRRQSYLIKEGMTVRDHAIEFNRMLTYLKAN